MAITSSAAPHFFLIDKSLKMENKQGAGENDLRSLPSGGLNRIIHLLHSLIALAALHQQPPLSVDLLLKVFVYQWENVGFELEEICRKWTNSNYWTL